MNGVLVLGTRYSPASSVSSPHGIQVLQCTPRWRIGSESVISGWGLSDASQAESEWGGRDGVPQGF